MCVILSAPERGGGNDLGENFPTILLYHFLALFSSPFSRGKRFNEGAKKGRRKPLMPAPLD
jgi:hypothetical protein